ncbi:ABC transporter substrate-binding protein [Paenibacillus abyssi]|uniref:ABC transporter substrate-binding protein n=1 Tax=Paenibacillus abyssi TaxID=1340531 RepID=A0A917FW10_9BACL|nr:extracellular solute-binding protein [Paenibacillus abyssi]GGG10386.1 hypothetical protein GCM10010916_29060 [Paenibacillus abyssi]
MSRRKYMLLLLGFLMLFIVVIYPMLRLQGVELTRPQGDAFTLLPEQDSKRGTAFKELRVTVSMEPSEFFSLQQASRIFSESHSNVYITLDNVPTIESYEHFKNDARLGEAADVMLVDNNWVSEFAALGFLKPTDALLTGETLIDQMSGLLQPLKWNGYVWGVPKDADPLVLVWSSRLLKEAGFDHPPEDWAAFLEVTSTIAALEGPEYGETKWISFDASDVRQWMIWMSALNGRPSDPKAPEALAGERLERLRFVNDAAGRIGDWNLLDDENELVSALEAGRLLSAVVPWSIASGMTGSSDSLLVLGEHTQKNPLWTNGRSFVISSRTGVEEEARAWIESVTNVHNQGLFYEDYGKLPARKSLYNGNLSDVPPKWLQYRLEEELDTKTDLLWAQLYWNYSAAWRQWREGQLAEEDFIRVWNEQTAKTPN